MNPGKLYTMDSLNSRIYYLRKKIIFPHSIMTVSVPSGDNSEDISAGGHILAFPIRTILDIILPMNRIATLSEIVEVKNDDTKLFLQLKGIERVKITAIKHLKTARYTILPEKESPSPHEILENLRKKSQELIFLINVDESDKLISLLNYLTDLSQITDFIANYFVLDYRERRRLFYNIDPQSRARKLIDILDRLITRMKNRRDQDNP